MPFSNWRKIFERFDGRLAGLRLSGKIEGAYAAAGLGQWSEHMTTSQVESLFSSHFEYQIFCILRVIEGMPNSIVYIVTESYSILCIICAMCIHCIVLTVCVDLGICPGGAFSSGAKYRRCWLGGGEGMHEVVQLLCSALLTQTTIVEQSIVLLTSVHWAAQTCPYSALQRQLQDMIQVCASLGRDSALKTRAAKNSA